jgi:hypothetical protein
MRLIIFIFVLILLISSNINAQSKFTQLNKSLFLKDTLVCQIEKDSLGERGDTKYCSGGFQNGYYVFMSQKEKNKGYQRLGIGFRMNYSKCPILDRRASHFAKVFFYGDSINTKPFEISNSRCRQSIDCDSNLTIMLWRSTFTKEEDKQLDIFKERLVKAIRIYAWGKHYDITFTTKQSEGFRKQFIEIEN